MMRIYSFLYLNHKAILPPKYLWWHLWSFIWKWSLLKSNNTCLKCLFIYLFYFSILNESSSINNNAAFPLSGEKKCIDYLYRKKSRISSCWQWSVWNLIADDLSMGIIFKCRPYRTFDCFTLYVWQAKYLFYKFRDYICVYMYINR